jgi:hypothetical protein
LIAAGVAASCGGVTFGANVDIVNSNGTIANQLLSSNGGLGGANFIGTEANGVGVYLRARDRGLDPAEGQNRSGSVYSVQPRDPGDIGTQLSFEFQFSPKNGDTTSNSNYWLALSIDSDPSAATNFTQGLAAPVFDADSDPLDGSWDDGDSLVEDGVTVRGGNIVSFQSFRAGGLAPDYVVVNSWTPEFGFLGGTALGAGLWDFKLEVFELNGAGDGPGTFLAGTQITAKVVPMPTASVLGAAGLGLVTLRRRRAA